MFTAAGCYWAKWETGRKKVQPPFCESVILALHVSFSAESPSHGLLSVPPWQLPIGWFAWKSIRIQGNGELQLLFTRTLRPWLSHPDPFLPSVSLSFFVFFSHSVFNILPQEHPEAWPGESFDKALLILWFFLKDTFLLTIFCLCVSDFTKLTFFVCKCHVIFN